MKNAIFALLGLAGALLLSQPAVGQEDEDEKTLEERVERIEETLARIDRRLERVINALRDRKGDDEKGEERGIHLKVRLGDREYEFSLPRGGFDRREGPRRDRDRDRPEGERRDGERREFRLELPGPEGLDRARRELERLLESGELPEGMRERLGRALEGLGEGRDRRPMRPGGPMARERLEKAIEDAQRRLEEGGENLPEEIRKRLEEGLERMKERLEKMGDGEGHEGHDHHDHGEKDGD